MKSFGDYLDSEFKQGKTEFRVVVNRSDGHTEFYIHPLGKDGESCDFATSGDFVENITQYCQRKFNDA